MKRRGVPHFSPQIVPSLRRLPPVPRTSPRRPALSVAVTACQGRHREGSVPFPGRQLHTAASFSRAPAVHGPNPRRSEPRQTPLTAQIFVQPRSVNVSVLLEKNPFERYLSIGM